MEEQIKRRLLDLAAQSDRIGTFTFSPFLSEAEYIGNTLERVRHTTVRCSIVETLPETFNAQTVPETVQAASLRADLLIAKVFHMSRSACDSCFASEKVFVNGRAVSQPGMTLKEGDKVSVRGFGKFRFCGVSGQTRKGNLIVEIARFGN